MVINAVRALKPSHMTQFLAGQSKEQDLDIVVNNETLFVLNYFKVKEPDFINDVKVRIKNLDYLKGHMISKNNTLYDSYKLMLANKVNKIPVIDDNRRLLGIVGLRDIVEVMTNSNNLDTTYDNIVKVLNGTDVNKTVTDLVNNTKVELLEINSLSNLTDKQRSENEDYFSLVNENIEMLKKELY